MDLPRLIQMLGPGLPTTAYRDLAEAWNPRFVDKGGVVARQGEAATDEVMLLDGKIVSLITDHEGRAVCVGLYKAPGIVAPQISRTREGISLVTLEVTAGATLAETGADRLLALMVRDPDIRGWANGILRRELSCKSDREWCLAALGGVDRLAWFRDRYPGYEAEFGHGHIASFLGMTAVSLSRLRSRA